MWCSYELTSFTFHAHRNVVKAKPPVAAAFFMDFFTATKRTTWSRVWRILMSVHWPHLNPVGMRLNPFLSRPKFTDQIFLETEVCLLHNVLVCCSTSPLTNKPAFLKRCPLFPFRHSIVQYLNISKNVTIIQFLTIQAQVSFQVVQKSLGCDEKHRLQIIANKTPLKTCLLFRAISFCTSVGLFKKNYYKNFT